MKIEIHPASADQRRAKPADENNLVFGKTFSDHMFVMDYASEEWRNARIVPYGNFQFDPAAMVLHYAQGIFEGLKAYRCPDGRIHLFRPEENWARLNRSARRMCMPEVDVEVQLRAFDELLKLDRDWIPHTQGASLYIRPTMIATEPALGVRPAKEYLYFIITGPVGAYYPEGFNPIKIFVTDEYVRAALGGVGEAKTMGNYAASLYAAEMAKKEGFTQVLWLDAAHRKYVEEVGTMNIFFRMGDKLVTPPLTGSILPGVTRDSVIRLARHWNVPVEERLVSIDEVVETIDDGSMKEIFGSGTAAVISPVGEIYFKEKHHRVGDGGVGEWSHRFYDEIVGIQYGTRQDPFGWVRLVP